MEAALLIRLATTDADYDAVRRLCREYAGTPGLDLCFQSFEEELTELAGRYGPPSGCVLLATVDGEPAGCVALRKLADGACEMKRLYVPERHRRIGLGRLLVGRLVHEARRLGYDAMRLDTLPGVMSAAVALYRSLGFRDILPDQENPVPGAICLELLLERHTSGSAPHTESDRSVTVAMGCLPASPCWGEVGCEATG